MPCLHKHHQQHRGTGRATPEQPHSASPSWTIQAGSLTGAVLTPEPSSCREIRPTAWWDCLKKVKGCKQLISILRQHWEPQVGLKSGLQPAPNLLVCLVLVLGGEQECSLSRKSWIIQQESSSGFASILCTWVGKKNPILYLCSEKRNFDIRKEKLLTNRNQSGGKIHEMSLSC